MFAFPLVWLLMFLPPLRGWSLSPSLSLSVAAFLLLWPFCAYLYSGSWSPPPLMGRCEKHSVAAKLEDGLFPQSVFCSNVPYTIKSTSLSSKLYLKAKATPSRDPLTLTILQIVSCSKSAKGAENHGVSNKLPKGTPFVQGHAAVGILIRPW